MRSMGIAGMAAAVALLAACATPPGRADPLRSAALNAGVPANDIADIRSYDRVSDAGELVGYEAWVQLESCPGFVVLELDTGYGVQDAYVRGDCTVPGLDTGT